MTPSPIQGWAVVVVYFDQFQVPRVPQSWSNYFFSAVLNLFLLILNLLQWFHAWNQQKTTENKQEKWYLSTPQSWLTCKSCRKKMISRYPLEGCTVSSIVICLEYEGCTVSSIVLLLSFIRHNMVWITKTKLLALSKLSEDNLSSQVARWHYYYLGCHPY